MGLPTTFPRLSGIAALVIIGLVPFAGAHPVPDIPVHADFWPDGKVTLRAEIDPRCFSEDPLNEPYLENAAFQTYSARQKQSLIAKASRLLSESIELQLAPGESPPPHFRFSFTTFGSEQLEWDSAAPEKNTESCAVAPVMITAEWTGNAKGFDTYQVRATKLGKFSIQVITKINGDLQPLNVLFPGESSAQVSLQSRPALGDRGDANAGE